MDTQLSPRDSNWIGELLAALNCMIAINAAGKIVGPKSLARYRELVDATGNPAYSILRAEAKKSIESIGSKLE